MVSMQYPCCHAAVLVDGLPRPNAGRVEARAARQAVLAEAGVAAGADAAAGHTKLHPGRDCIPNLTHLYLVLHRAFNDPKPDRKFEP